MLSKRVLLLCLLLIFVFISVFSVYRNSLFSQRKRLEGEEITTYGPNWLDTKHPDGTHTRKFFSAPISARPTNIVASSVADYAYEGTSDLTRAYFKEKPKSDNFLKFQLGDVWLEATFVESGLGEMAETSALVNGSVITYPEIYPGVSVRYTLSPTSLLEEIILDSFVSFRSVRQQVRVENGRLELESDGSISIISDRTQEPVGQFPPPNMYEEKSLGAVRFDLHYELERTGDDYFLNKVIEERGQRWLESSTTTYPVVFDASYTGQTKDGYLYKYCSSGTYQSCRSASPFANTSQMALYLGQRWDTGFSEWWLWRSFVSFDTSSIPDNAAISSAALYARVRSDDSGRDFDIKLYSGDWGALGAEDWDTGNVYEGVFRNTLGLSTDSWYSKSVATSSVDKFGETQFRLVSSRDESATAPSADEYITFYSANSSAAPYLEVNFASPNNPPNEPINPSPFSGVSDISVFTVLNWTGGDPDAGDSVRYDVYFEAADSTPDVKVSSNQSGTSYEPNASLDSTGDYTRRVALRYDTRYYWQIVARDGQGATTPGQIWDFRTVAAPSQYTFIPEFSGGKFIDGYLTKSEYVSGSCGNALNQILSKSASVEDIGGTGSLGIAGYCNGGIENPVSIFRTYLSFDTAGLPDDAYISGATLYFTTYLSGIPSPVPPRVDFAVYSGNNCWGGSLDSSDWDACAKYEGNIIENVGGTTNIDDREFSVAVEPASINKRGRTQFRLTRIYPPDDQLYGGTIFSSDIEGYLGDNPSHYPRLVINSGTPPAINTPPNVPVLECPVDGRTWVNYNPTYKARLIDPDSGDIVYAFFDFESGPSAGNGSSGTTPFQSRYRPDTPDGEFRFRAKGIDDKGAQSNYTDYCWIRKDTVAPTCNLDQENGISPDTSIWVRLVESDDRSGIAPVAGGDVDYRLNGGSWINYSSTIDDFTFTGVNGNTYEFRYRVKDNAENWSTSCTDGSVLIQTASCETSFPNDTFHACVFDGTNFSSYVGGFDESNINHNWDLNCPAELSGNCDTWSAVWRGNIRFTSAYFKFRSQSDDGARLYVDLDGDGNLTVNERIIDNWSDGASDDYSLWYYLSTRNRKVMLEFYENTAQAAAILSWVSNNYPRSPSGLLTNNRTNPTDLTGEPFFSAIYNDPDPGDIANAYRIQVDDNSDFSSPLWDSGTTGMANCLEGERCQDISYAGPGLSSGLRYYWRIRYRDDDSFVGPWSVENAYFELQNFGMLTGYVWRDGDGDCRREFLEDNYYNNANPARMWLRKNGLDVLSPFNTDATLAPGNNFTVSGIPQGSYDLVFTPPVGWWSTTRSVIPVNISSGQTTAVPQCP